jgi:uncharacterized protein YaaW (UPF0174 family)
MSDLNEISNFIKKIQSTFKNILYHFCELLNKKIVEVQVKTMIRKNFRRKFSMED